MSEEAKRGRPRKERYAKLMGGFWRNDKARRLSLEARGLLMTAWSYAADQMTDGRVPVELLQAWAGKRYTKLMGELSPFLAVTDIDAQCHDWLAHNISSEQWEGRLAKERERKRNSDHFPDGKSPDIPRGNPEHFRGHALDEDEDDSSPTESGARARPTDQPGSLVTLADELRAGVSAGFAAIGLPIPQECRVLTWPGWVRYARWIREKSKLDGAAELEVGARSVRAFLGSKRARDKGFPVSFLVQNPLEFWSEAA
jgi:hypothetical protein